VTHRIRWSFVLAVLVVAAGLAAARESAPSDGAARLAPFKRDLRQALEAGLAEGPVEAVGACQLRAPAIAADRSQEGVRVGRSSHRLRNPANAPPEWVAPILDAYGEETADRAPRTVTLAADRMGYVEPILVQPLCLTCHGAALAPEVAARIETLYPQDRAVGYQAGELRGVFWIEFPAPK